MVKKMDKKANCIRTSLKTFLQQKVDFWHSELKSQGLSITNSTWSKKSKVRVL